MKCLLTGTSGFLGRNVYKRLSEENELSIIGCVRSRDSETPSDWLEIGNIDSQTDWSNALTACETVIHMAARAHILIEDQTENSLEIFRESNSRATTNLASQAAIAGIKRFIFISSIGVNGSSNTTPFKESDIPAPTEPYAISKWEAEQGLREIQKETGMEIVIIRPPLIYGPNAPGNFGKMIKWLETGIPLPFGTINNKRSLISVNNLAEIIYKCIIQDEAANQLFLVSDGDDISTTAILKAAAKGKKIPARLIPIPQTLLTLAAAIIGKRDTAKKVLGSLQIDPSKSQKLLGLHTKKTTDLIQEII